MMKNYDCPMQVAFMDEEGNIAGGIAYNDFIICGECGSVLPLDECTVLKEYSKLWVDLSDDILGDDSF